MSIQKIKTGVLSYGMSGRIFHTPFLEESKYFELYGIVERSKKSAKDKYPDIISFDSVSELINDTEIELVVINTPNYTHYDFAKQALSAGKHVLMEKPFTPTKAEAEELFRIGKKMKRWVLPYQNRRFDSEFLALKQVLDSHKIGQPIELHLRFDRFRQEIGPKVFKETKKPGSGILYDLGSHLLDQVISLFGQPKSFFKILKKHREDTEVDDYAFLLLNYGGGMQVHITTTMLALDPLPSIVVHGTKGTFIKHREDPQEQQLSEGVRPTDEAYGVEREGAEGTLKYIDQQSNIITEKVASVKGNYMHLFDALYQTIRHDKQYFATRGDILCQLEILEAPKNTRIKLK